MYQATPSPALAGDGDSVLFAAELRPNRSSTPGAIKWLALLVGIAMVPVALGFFLLGAWPVFGFMGLELALLVALLHFNFRRSGVVERVQVTERQVHLERINHWGRREAWSFPRHWARVKLTGTDDRDCRLEVRSHGRVVPLGGFLTPGERREVWSAMNRFVSAICAPAKIQARPAAPGTVQGS
jgi:uncharacterized membrane protein